MIKMMITIKTNKCDVCSKIDSVMLDKDEILQRTKSTDMGVGSYSTVHKDHTRIVYFDEKGQYLGDTIILPPTKKIRQKRKIKEVFYFELWDHVEEETFGVMVTTRKLTDNEFIMLEKIIKNYVDDDKNCDWEYDMIVGIVSDQLSKWGINIRAIAQKMVIV